MEMNNPQEGTLTNEKRESARRSFYAFLGSSKFGLFLLLAVGCVSLLGMFILQNAPQEQYVSRYGEFWGNLIRLSGLGSVYRVWWYLLLISVTCLNLVFCSLRRVRFSLKQAFSKPRPEDHGLLRTARSVSVAVEASDLLGRMEHHVRDKGFAISSSDEGSAKLIAGQRGGISRVGFLVTHLAVILVLIAGVVNGRLGYRFQRPISIGESLDVKEIEPTANFSIRVDDFDIETTEEGKIRDYKSTLTVVEGGKDVLTKVIEVNHPLTYKGLSFYQASYGQEPDRFREARIIYFADEQAHTVIDIPFEETRRVPGTNMEIRVTDFVPHFVKDLTTGRVRTRSLEPKMPAVRMEVLREGEVVGDGWLIMGMDAHSGTEELGHFHFADYFPLFYTGIDVTTNPGVVLMFTGFGVASMGILLSFFISYRRIWVKVLPTEGGHSELRIAGMSRRDPLALKREIDKLYELVAATETHGKGEESARE
jgi:cytochrome c biogenesis protein